MIVGPSTAWGKYWIRFTRISHKGGVMGQGIHGPGNACHCGIQGLGSGRRASAKYSSASKINSPKMTHVAPHI